jgi:MFS family permease
MKQQPAGLWRHSDFMKLWLGQTVSQFGSHISGAALPFVAFLTLGATPLQLGILGALGSLPILLFGLVAGVWVDRLRRRPILIGADLGRALILGTIPLAALLGALRIEWLYVVAALTGLLTVFFDVAYATILPSLVERRQLVEANSKLSTSGALAEIGGPSLAGFLVQLISAPFAILIDAVSFLLSALGIILIRTPEPPPPPVAERRPLLGDIAEGLRLVLRQPILRALAGSAATSTFFGNFIGVLYSIYCVKELGIPPARVGVMIGLGGVGAVIGALVTGPITRRFGVGRSIIGAILFAVTVNAMIPLVWGPPLLVAGILMATQVIGDIAWPVHSINEQSLRQAIVPDRLLGRANASMQFLIGGLAPLGALLGGWLGEVIGMRPTLWIAIGGLLLSTLWLIFSPVRDLRETPDAPGAPPDALSAEAA